MIEFYNRDGGFSNKEHRDLDIQPLGLTAQEKKDLFNFMVALTDPRVKLEMAPFDQPDHFVPNGHPGDRTWVKDSNKDGMADDQFISIPSVGRPKEGILGLKPFNQTF